MYPAFKGPTMDNPSSKDALGSSLFPGRGCLKLSVYVNYGMLTVHVVQGRSLCSNWSTFCNAYVRTSLVPDDMKRTKCKTRVIQETNKPLFDEKFSYELLEGDSKKRLLVSVWHKEPTSGMSELLGCMSFGIRHIEAQTRVINGWYYLLSEDLGRRKHLPLVSNRPTPQPIIPDTPETPPRGCLPQPCDQSPDSPDTPCGRHQNDNMENVWLDELSLVVGRGVRGYGFSVAGSRPVQVCSVEHGSTAHYSGLQVDDFILSINGADITSASAHQVAALIRQCTRSLVMTIQRPRRLVPFQDNLALMNKASKPLSHMESVFQGVKRKASFTLKHITLKKKKSNCTDVEKHKFYHLR